MANKVNIKKVQKMRYTYFLNVYKKYIYNIFTENNRPEKEQVILGMEEHCLRPEILQEYLNNNDFNQTQKDIIGQWKNDIYGNMHLICLDKNKVYVYCEETDAVYYVKLVDIHMRSLLKSIPFYVRIHATLFQIENEYYFDSIINIQSKYDSSLEICEKLYEHIYQIILKQPKLLNRCFIYSQRNLQKDKFSKIFLDFLGPLSPVSMDIDELEDTLKLGMIAWNGNIVDEIGKMIPKNKYFNFLSQRKEKYFSNINRVMLDYEIEYNKDGFEVITASLPYKKDK